MPRAVNTTTSAPFVKLVDLGDTIVGAFAGSAQRQIVNFKTRLPEWKDEEKKIPRREEILHLVAMPGTTAHVGTDDQGYTPIEPGDHVRYSVQGFQWSQVIQGRKDLPAAHGFKAGQICSSDVYTIRLVGWSASTDNAAAATKAGFTVADGRIVMRSQQDKDAYVLARSRKNQSTGVGKDLEITLRRIELPNEQKWADLADELYDTKPWEGGATASVDATASAGGGGPSAPADDDAYTGDDEEPF